MFLISQKKLILKTLKHYLINRDYEVLCKLIWRLKLVILKIKTLKILLLNLEN